MLNTGTSVDEIRWNKMLMLKGADIILFIREQQQRRSLLPLNPTPQLSFPEPSNTEAFLFFFHPPFSFKANELTQRINTRAAAAVIISITLLLISSSSFDEAF